MSDPEQNRLTACKRFFVSKKNVWRAVYPASRVRVPKRACGRVWGINPSGDQAHTQRNECLLSLESAGSESRQKLFANIRGQNDFWECTYDVCHRRAYACVHRGCKIGMDIARIWPVDHRCHTRDLSALIDIASRDYGEVGIPGN